MNQEMLNGFERYIEENKIPVHDIVVYQDGQVKARKNWDSIQLSCRKFAEAQLKMQRALGWYMCGKYKMLFDIL